MLFRELIYRNKKLIKFFNKIENKLYELQIKGISNNSKKIKENYIFVAIRGNKKNGNDFISEAKKNGSKIIISSEKRDKDILYLENANISLIYALLCSSFYNKSPENIIGVTGTNGKTSIVDFCRQMWSLAGWNSASIGTLGVKYLNDNNYKNNTNNLTTLDPMELHNQLSSLYKKNITHLALEASSHGIIQNRIAGINFTGAVFINLSHDHLDFHNSTQNYYNAKKLLFTNYLKEGSIVSINLDDKYGETLFESIKNKNFRFINFGKHHKADLKIKKIVNIKKIWQIELEYKNRLITTNIGLIGNFQVYNALAAASICLGLNMDEEFIFKSLSYLKTVPGRMQVVSGHPKKALIIIDYAHTPDALKNAILSVRKNNSEGKIYTLFGCGGERDIHKRSLMGKVSYENSDFTIITDDNPRTEDPSTIRKQIIETCPNAIEIAGRNLAIKKAISLLNQNDVLIIAGKGHEKTQTIGTETLPFDDLAIVNNEFINYSYDH